MHKVKHRFPYKWNLKDGYPGKNNGLKVFGTFVCGGGSTMGYKLAGFEHIGGVELTDHYSQLYISNHRPKFFYTQDIRKFNLRNDLPKDLYNIDLLDGSPPCASFSTVGAREKKWGQEKEYEGHRQKTDDLVFEFVATIAKLNPKCFLMENVSGLIKGNAKVYVRNIFKSLEKVGYSAQIFSINAASLGVPQMRQRVFIIGSRKDLGFQKLKLDFNEPMISFKEATEEFWNKGGESIKRCSIFKYWNEIKYPNETSHSVRFSVKRPALDKPCNTLIESDSTLCTPGVCHPLQPRKLNKWEASVLQSYPLDYDFLNENPLSCIGRSVPPVMTAQIASQIANQWFGVPLP
jgi:DNA (cytosine-5)-methyltransferase 1